MTELDPTAEPMQPVSNAALTTALAPSRGKARFVRYIVGHGWLHLMLLTAVGIFLFPFIYMFGTSMKTDEELTDAAWFPAIPHFQPRSPRVRETPEAARPLEAPPEKWEQVLPQIRKLARAAVDAATLPPGGDAVDVGQYRAAAAEYLVGRLVSRLNPDLWNGEIAKYVAAFKAALTADTINDALDSRLARLEFHGLQIRSLDSRVYNVISGKDICDELRIDTPDSHLAQMTPANDGAILRYRFTGSTASPIQLIYNFTLPCEPENFHKLMLAIKPDDSWNQISAILTIGDTRWQSEEVRYLGTTRNESIIYQPPSFDDMTDRSRHLGATETREIDLAWRFVA